MRIFLSGHHTFPAKIRGPAGCRVMDNVARGLVELGHETYYQLGGGIVEPLPDGVQAVAGPVHDADVWHVQDANANGVVEGDVPWVRTYHSNEPLTITAPDRCRANNWIFVSRYQANANGSTRFVYNGIDPEEVIYSESKEDYFLFVVSHLSRAESKGLAIAMELRKRCGFRLVIAGGTDQEVAEWRERYPNKGIEFAGWINGRRRAEMFAGARALLFPTQLEETFGLVSVEAMMSGTPVIASDRGACPEVVTADVGFTCSGMDDYVRAVERSSSISPQACRKRAISRFHYLIMARSYVSEYLVQMARGRAESVCCTSS